MPPPPEFNLTFPGRDGWERAGAKTVPADDDLVLGWECATPALQIEGWGAAEDSATGTEFH